MTTLRDPILLGKKIPSLELLKEHTILGGSEAVETRLKEKGWSEASHAAAVILDFVDL